MTGQLVKDTANVGEDLHLLVLDDFVEVVLHALGNALVGGQDVDPCSETVVVDRIGDKGKMYMRTVVVDVPHRMGHSRKHDEVLQEVEDILHMMDVMVNQDEVECLRGISDYEVQHDVGVVVEDDVSVVETLEDLVVAVELLEVYLMLKGHDSCEVEQQIQLVFRMNKMGEAKKIN